MNATEQHKTYVSILADSLEKKDALLFDLIMLTEEQKQLLSFDEELDMEEFEHVIKEKDAKLKELDALDRGFELVYANVKEAFRQEKESFVQEIKTLQEMIRRITEKGVMLETLEHENKRKLEIFFLQKRTQIKNFKMSNKTVSNYYKNMSGRTEESSYFVDKRK